MVEKDIGGGICHSVYRYTKANSKYMKQRFLSLLNMANIFMKYMKDYHKNKESSYIQY